MSLPITTMNIYKNADRIYNELRELGIADSDTLTAAQISPFDQLHYEGTTAVERAIKSCALRAGLRVLDVGSGIGGPARHLAATAGVSVTAVELQEDQHTTAAALTERCKLDALVKHVCGDFLASETVVGDRFDAVVSWLAFLHIPDRATLLSRCFAVLRPGGRMYVEDYARRGEFTAAEEKSLREDVFISYLPTPTEYVDQLKGAGFTSIEMEDVTPTWVPFVRARLDQFRAARERHSRVHGEPTVKRLEHFYAAMVTLFEGGNLGGVRYVATKPE